MSARDPNTGRYLSPDSDEAFAPDKAAVMLAAWRNEQMPVL